MLFRFIRILLFFALLAACKSDIKPQNTEKTLQIEELAETPPVMRNDTFRITRGGTLARGLRKIGVSNQDSYYLIEEVKKSFDLRKLMPKTLIQVTYADDVLIGLKIPLSKTEYALYQRKDAKSAWKTDKLIVTPRVQISTYQGTVTSSLWNSAMESGVDPSLIMELAEIFSWEFDFNREVRPKDKWRLTVEEKFIDGELVGRKPIKVAEYKTKDYSMKAIYHKGKSDKYGSYFKPNGQSLKRVFLKSPLAFGRVTSRFNRKRFHPILKRNIPHNGVDYGAKPGTPVRTVGDGRVSFAGRNGGSGIMVRVRHNATYKTAYLHLKGLAKGIRRGKRVQQGQVIGYVGSTGLATGPHLHFSFYENGRFVDPLGRKFPSKDPVPRGELAAYKKKAAEALTLLPLWPRKPERFSWFFPPKSKGNITPVFLF